MARGLATGVGFLDGEVVAAQGEGHDVHGLEQRLGPWRTGEQGGSPGVRDLLIGRELLLARLRQPGDAAAGIGGMRLGGDQALLLQAPEQAAHQPGIEAQIVADRGHIRAAMADGIEHARGAERTAPAEEGGVQRPDLPGHGTAEAAEAADRIGCHDV